MDVIYISGSPRKKSNTDFLLKRLRSTTGGEFFKLVDLEIAPCVSCWACRKTHICAIDDDMSQVLVPKMLAAEAIVLGTPVYFNNVTAQIKAFIDRTWALRGQLRNKVGGAVVVGRRYGAEGAITAINAFFLKHEMLIANRGISGIAFRSGEITDDNESLQATDRLAARILDLAPRTVPDETDETDR